MKLFSIKSSALILVASFIVNICYAQESSKNQLQLDYQQSLSKVSFSRVPFSSVYYISEATYHYLDSAFNNFYQTLSFDTSIKDSTFQKSKQYEIISIPFIANNIKVVQFELFGKLSDPKNDNHRDMAQDNPLYEYFENSEVLDIYNSELSLGAGISFQTSPFSKVKVLISNKNLPGYGSSQALIGFESSF